MPSLSGDLPDPLPWSGSGECKEGIQRWGHKPQSADRGAGWGAQKALGLGRVGSGSAPAWAGPLAVCRPAGLGEGRSSLLSTGAGKLAAVSSRLERSRFRGPSPAPLSREKCFDSKKP